MDLQRFEALRTGATVLPDGEPAELVVHPLGVLRVPSGRLAIADTTALGDAVVVQVEPGDYPVVLTTARVREEYDLREGRETYISVLLSDAATVSVAPVAGLDGVSVGEVASVALTDFEAIELGMPADSSTWYDEVIATPSGGGWFGLMDSTEGGPLGTVNVELPNAPHGENVVVVISRGGHTFPVLETRDATGALTGIHVDLLVMGELTEQLGAFDGRDENARYLYEVELPEQKAAEAKRTKKRRFFGLFG